MHELQDSYVGRIEKKNIQRCDESFFLNLKIRFAFIKVISLCTEEDTRKQKLIYLLMAIIKAIFYIISQRRESNGSTIHKRACPPSDIA